MLLKFEADSPAWEVEGEGGIVGSSLATPDYHHTHLSQSNQPYFAIQGPSEEAILIKLTST